MDFTLKSPPKFAFEVALRPVRVGIDAKVQYAPQSAAIESRRAATHLVISPLGLLMQRLLGGPSAQRNGCR